ncbi:MAG: mechanosensitive ion channel [Candidatus Kapabacteria bacterium]|nr:mechanosensitive ion channel [Candidatus Kapabacteria bacterium]
MVFGLTSPQWLTLALLIIGSTVAVTILRRIIGTLLRWILRRFKIEPDKSLVRLVARSFALGIVAESDRIVVPWVGLNAQSVATVGTWIDALAMVFVFIAIYRLVDLVCSRTVEHVLRKRANGRDAATTLAPLIGSALKVLVATIALVTVLGFLGVNVAAILTGLSIGGVAFALASQDTIKNLFGSAVILADHPFGVGDWIIVQEAEGIVEEIGFRSTRIRTFADSVITVPNGRLADMTIDNLGARSFRRYRTSVLIEHATPPDKIRRYVQAIRDLINAHPLTVKAPERIIVGISEISPLGYTISVVMFVDSSMLKDEPGFKHDINMEIISAAEKLQIQFAKPGELERSARPGKPA